MGPRCSDEEMKQHFDAVNLVLHEWDVHSCVAGGFVLEMEQCPFCDEVMNEIEIAYSKTIEKLNAQISQATDRVHLCNEEEQKAYLLHKKAENDIRFVQVEALHIGRHEVDPAILLELRQAKENLELFVSKVWSSYLALLEQDVGCSRSIRIEYLGMG